MHMHNLLTGWPLYGILTVLLSPSSILYVMVYEVRIPLRLFGILHSTRTDVESIAVTALIIGGLGAAFMYMYPLLLTRNKLYLLQLSLLQ